MLDKEKYYTLTELTGGRKREKQGASPLLTAKGYWYTLKQIKSGELKSVNTSNDTQTPRFLVKGSDVVAFENKLLEK